MALKLNPATGKMEDDGQPEPPAGAVAPVLPTLFPPKPERETTVTTEQRIASPESKAAQGDVIEAQANVLNAQHRETDLAVDEAGIKAAGAAEKVALLEQQQRDKAAKEAERQRAVAEYMAGGDQRIEELRKAKVGTDLWDGNAGGEILAAILRGVDRAASSFRGESGPTGVDRIIDAKIQAHERKKIAAYEATKEAQELKRTNYDGYLQGLDRVSLKADEESTASLLKLEAKTDAAFAALGPERAKALDASKVAAFQNTSAALASSRAEKTDKVIRASVTNRSPTANRAPTERPLSAETQSKLAGSETYNKLSARNEQIVRENGMKVPYTGKLATEYETNNKKMATILQGPLGKSDNDAQTARELQGAPGFKDRLSGAMGITDPVGNYLKSLEVNRKTLADEANKAAELEGKPNRVSTPTDAPGSSQKAEYQQLINKANAAGDKATADALTKEMNAL